MLTELAFQSKSYWKYDREYLEAARGHIQITARDIEQDHVYLIEDDQNILGFYHLSLKEMDSELIWFFVHPASIGMGLGQLLWNHLLLMVRALEISEFIIKSDPNAEPFYLKQGALRIGYKSSTVREDMKLPLLRYRSPL